MGKFINSETGVVVSVDDSKDARFASGFEPYTEKKTTRKTSSTSSDSSK